MLRSTMQYGLARKMSRLMPPKERFRSIRPLPMNGNACERTALNHETN